MLKRVRFRSAWNVKWNMKQWNLTSFSCQYNLKTQVWLIRKFIWPFWLNPRLILCLIHREHLFSFFFLFFTKWNLTDYDWKLLSLFKPKFKVSSKYRKHVATKMEIVEFWIHEIRAAGICTLLKLPGPECSEKMRVKSWWIEKNGGGPGFGLDL